VSRGRLVWRLLGDRRVPLWLKGLPLVTLLYVLSPIDAIPEVLLPVLGPLIALDDLGAILLGLNFFIMLSPPDVVADHERRLAAEGGWRVEGDAAEGSPGGATGAQDTPPVVDGSFRVVNDGKR
jgi:uncharacterized membrane protein YkvA (DUF1232 family)